MKKAGSIILIIALVFVIIGNIMYWGAKIYKHAKGDEINADIGNYDYIVNGDVNSIKLEARFAHVEIHVSNTFSCTFENVDLSGSSVEEVDGVLNIKAVNYENMRVFGWDIGNAVDPETISKVVLYVPEPVFYNTTVDVGSGSITIDRLKTGNLVMQLGVGTISILDMQADNGIIQVGTGSVSIDSLTSDSFEIKNGAGVIKVNQAAPDKRSIDRFGVGLDINVNE